MLLLTLILLVVLGVAGGLAIWRLWHRLNVLAVQVREVEDEATLTVDEDLEALIRLVSRAEAGQ